MAQDHWLHGFNYNVEEWFVGDRYITTRDCFAGGTERMAEPFFAARASSKYRNRNPPGTSPHGNILLAERIIGSSDILL